MRKIFYYHFCVVVVICHWFCNNRILRFHLKNYIKIHSVRYWEPDWLFIFTIIFQLNNGKNTWSSLKMQWQLPHLTNDCTIWPWSAKQWKRSVLLKNYLFMETCQIEIKFGFRKIFFFFFFFFFTSGKWFQSSFMTERFAPTTFGHDRFS